MDLFSEEAPLPSPSPPTTKTQLLRLNTMGRASWTPAVLYPNKRTMRLDSDVIVQTFCLHLYPLAIARRRYRSSVVFWELRSVPWSKVIIGKKAMPCKYMAKATEEEAQKYAGLYTIKDWKPK
jgi:hypothetical protein